MGQIATLNGTSVSGLGYNAAQLNLIKTQISPGLTEPEFNLFIEMARAHSLSPLTKQIYAIPYGKKDKRRVNYITGINGFRAIASRTGNYRPDDKATRFVYDENQKSDKNPTGLVSAEVTVHKYVHGEWFPTTVVALWDEYAPVTEVWEWDDRKGKKLPSGKYEPGGLWKEKPQVMLSKCAEAQALRRAFPESMGSFYEEAELGRLEIEGTATEIIDEAERQDRLASLGGPTIILTFSPGDPAEAIPVDDVFGRLMDHANAMGSNADNYIKFEWFMEHNRQALRQYYGHKKDEAVQFKARSEQVFEALKEAAETSQA